MSALQRCARRLRLRLQLLLQELHLIGLRNALDHALASEWDGDHALDLHLRIKEVRARLLSLNQEISRV